MSELGYFYREGDLFEGRLVVAFSSLNVSEGNFEFKTQFEPLQGARLYLNCPENGYYLNGVPGFAESLDDLGEKIKAYAEEHGASHIDMVASGMGTFAALATAGVAGADRVFGFSPVIQGGHELSPMKKFISDLPKEYADLTEKITSASDTEFYLFCSEAEVFDLYQALPLLEADNVQYRSISGSEPGLMKNIRGTDAFLRLLRTVAQGSISSSFFLPNQGNILRSPNLVQEIYEAKQDSRQPDWDAAMAKLNHVLEEDPTAETALFLKGIYHMTMREYAAAAETFANCAEINPNMKLYKERLEQALNRGKIDDELLWALTPAGKKPEAATISSEAADNLSVERRADLAFKAKNFEEAHQLFQTFVSTSTKDPSLLQRAAISAMKTEDFSTALRLQKIVQGQKEGDPSAEHHLGVMLAKSGNPKKALPHLKAAYDVESLNGGYAHQYALALAATGDVPGAIEILLEYVENGKGEKGILSSLAELADRAKMPQTRLVAAEKLLSVPGGEARGNYERAMALLSLEGDSGEIEQSFRIAATLDDKDKRITTAFADFLESTGRAVEAKAMRMVSRDM